MKNVLGILTVAMVLTVSSAQAHVGMGPTSGLAHGFVHPWSGIDHILTMIAVGVFAVHLGGRALWLVPLSFVGMMAVGGALGMEGVAIPFVETGIAFSVLALGLAVALGLDLSTVAAMACVGLFAVFHGHAHGAEMPESVSGLQYGAGFVLATASLHAVGIGIGLGVGKHGRTHGRRIAQAGGGAMALAGIALLAGYL